MSLISASGLAKSFGADDIFDNVSLSIPQGARVAVVGPNGIGKTTLLRILVGLDDPSQGKVQRAKGLRIGYLPQETSVLSGDTLWKQCMLAFKELLAVQAELHQLEKEMASPQKAPAYR